MQARLPRPPRHRPPWNPMRGSAHLFIGMKLHVACVPRIGDAVAPTLLQRTEIAVGTAGTDAERTITIALWRILRMTDSRAGHRQRGQHDQCCQHLPSHRNCFLLHVAKPPIQKPPERDYGSRKRHPRPVLLIARRRVSWSSHPMGDCLRIH